MLKQMKHSIIAFFLALGVSLGSWLGLLYSVDNSVSDRFYQKPNALDGTVSILGIDARALEAMGKFETWNRDSLADMIEALNADPDTRPAVIGLDLMLFSETRPEYDDRLTAACARYGNVVMGSSANFVSNSVTLHEDGSYSVSELAVEGFEEPFPALKAVTAQGHVNTMPDEDGVMRTNMHILPLPDGRISNSFAYQVYRMYAEKNGLPVDITPPMNERNQWYISFSGEPGAYSDGLSVLDLLRGDAPLELFANNIVLIGPYATGMMDAYRTAIDHAVPMYGVEIHANILQALLNQDFKQYVPRLWQSVFLFFVVFGMYLACKNLHPKYSTPLATAVIAIYFAFAALLGNQGYLLQLVYVPFAVVSLYVICLALNYTMAMLDKKRTTDTFKRYVAPQVVDEIMKHGKDALKLGGAKREIACMFVDIRGFTPMSEQMQPEEVVEVLNTYLELTSTSIFKHQGTLDKFIGDATMAIFNAPLDMDDYAYQAVLTAWDIVKGGDEMGEKLFKKYGRTVGFGIGLNLGPAIVGNIGTHIRMDYTAIGDTVNTAARLESQAKSGQVLMSESIYEAVKNRVQAECLGPMALKGKANGVQVYALRHINAYQNTQQAICQMEA